MVAIPPVTNTASSDRFTTSLIQALGLNIYLDLFEQRKEAFFLDIEDGNGVATSFAWRLVQQPADWLQYFRGEPLLRVPTVQEVIDNPDPHFRRLKIASSNDIRRVVAEFPDDAGTIMASLQGRRTQGDSLAQVITNAVNADKDVRSAFDSYVISARESGIAIIENLASATAQVTPTNLQSLVTDFSEFVIEAAFARQRRSGDGRRVSKEPHEFQYLANTVIRSYGPQILGQTRELGWTHIDVALRLIQFNIFRVNDEEAGITQGSNFADFDILRDQFENLQGLPNSCFDQANYSEGEFINSYNFRRLLARLKNIVQDTRLDNVIDVIRSTGRTRGQFIDEALQDLPRGLIAQAANDLVINKFLNPSRPVRQFINSTEVVQPSAI